MAWSVSLFASQGWTTLSTKMVQRPDNIPGSSHPICLSIWQILPSHQ